MRRLMKTRVELPARAATNIRFLFSFCLVVGCLVSCRTRTPAEDLPVNSEPMEAERLISTRVGDTVTLPRGRSEVDWLFFFQDLYNGEAISNSLGMRHGLTNRVEVGAFLWHTWMNPFASNSFGGLNDSSLYAKYAVMRPRDPNDFDLEASVGGMFFVPTGAEEHGFGFGEPYAGGFVALRKPVGPITLHGAYEYVNLNALGYRGFSAGSVAAFYHFDRLRAISLELAGNGKRQEHGGAWLDGIVGFHLAHPRWPMITRVGLIVGIDDTPYRWAVAFGLSFGL